ncbi:MAG: helix-hairpin-helix domain-containing protein [Planctomycetes bacterium]|nr:helix-hairpin-helix domain-containing protein [Planctomycetota bacterium]
MAEDLRRLGIRKVRDLKRRNPEKLYERLCDLNGSSIDRCVLYAFRCAVYYAREHRHDPELLKWWNWKD